MTAVATLNGTALTGRQLDLIRRTIAADCNDTEFDLFVEICRMRRLDPFRKQVFPLVFSKDNPQKRRMAIVVSRDGQRVIAQRCGNYRPASEPADIVFDETFKSPINPKGIVLCRIKLWQQDKQGQWWPVIGEAYWDEFAPVTDEWAYDQEKGKRLPTGKRTVDGNWQKMPVLMIQKVAEMQALRAGWPEEFGDLYDEAEMDRARVIDQDASEIVSKEQEERRLAAIGGKDTLLVSFDPMEVLERVPVGKFADRVIEWVEQSCDGPGDFRLFMERNRETFREFWSRAPADALELKKWTEAKERALLAQEDAETPDIVKTLRAG